jgi:hypothetical protein
MGGSFLSPEGIAKQNNQRLSPFVRGEGMLSTRTLLLFVIAGGAAAIGKYSAGAFYYGPWHVDPQNEELHGKNWTEWRLVSNSLPRAIRRTPPAERAEMGLPNG